MKRLFSIITSLAVLLTIVGCDSVSSLTGVKKTAQGSPYEVLVVCDAREWESPLGAELREVLGAPVEMLNQHEPMYDVMRVTARDFKHLLLSHRNIIKVLCSPSVKEVAMLAEYDVEATPQIVITFQGPSIKAMVAYLKENGESLCRVIEMAERNRTIEFAKQQGAMALEQLIKKKFGVDMVIPNGYKLRSESEDFLWISNEYPTASQGFFLYSRPLEGRASVTPKAMVDARNAFAKRIPGPADGSYMTTVTKIPNLDNDGYTDVMPECKALRINGHEWLEMRGFWDVYGDYMGGPFVSYTTVDKASGRLLTLDCYIYSPKEDKRNFLRQLEHLVYGISFPTEKSNK